MAIKSRPTPSLPKHEKKVQALIRKGAGVKEPVERTMLVQLRLPTSLVTQIDNDRYERIVPPSRHAWLLEAIKLHLGFE